MCYSFSVKRTAVDATWFSWVSHKGREARYSKSCWWTVEGYRTSHSLSWSLVAHSVQCGSLKLAVTAVTSMGISLATGARNSARAEKQAHGKGKQAGWPANSSKASSDAGLLMQSLLAVRHRLSDGASATYFVMLYIQTSQCKCIINYPTIKPHPNSS